MEVLPDNMTVIHESRTCRFHKLNPFKTYAGCTCSGSWALVKSVKQEEGLENKMRRSLHNLQSFTDQEHG